MAEREGAARWRLEPAPAAEPRLAGWRVDAALPWPMERAVPIGRNDGRAVWRIESAVPGGAALYAKLFERSARGVAEREEASLRACARLGLPAPPLVAKGRARNRSLLVVEAVAGRPLDEALAEVAGRARRPLLRAVAATIGALHGCGVVHGELYAWHVLVHGTRAAVIDWAQARVAPRPRRAPRNGRARDWAALFATLDRAHLSLSERARLLAWAEPDRAERRRLALAIRAARGELFAKARLPRPRAVVDRGDATGRVVVERRVAQQWSRATAVDAAESWLAPAEATIVRRRDGRVNLRWSEPPGEAGATWFGKRFERAPWRGRSPAFQEWVNGRALAAAGIAVPDHVAVARFTRGASILWTRGVAPGATLRELLPTLDRASPRRRALLLEAANLARRLHAAGFVHRDLYLDHFLLEAAPRERLVVIDHSRVAWFKTLPARARTKDLAALEFSARAAGATRAERWRALLAYARGDRRAARRLVAAALAKAARIAAHERRHGRPAPAA
jgi:tRNA A-37 threonylcarbamoyl transferase component Bud32